MNGLTGAERSQSSPLAVVGERLISFRIPSIYALLEAQALTSETIALALKLISEKYGPRRNSSRRLCRQPARSRSRCCLRIHQPEIIDASISPWAHLDAARQGGLDLAVLRATAMARIAARQSTNCRA